MINYQINIARISKIVTLCLQSRNCKYKCNIYSKHDYTNFILNKYKYFINQRGVLKCRNIGIDVSLSLEACETV